MESRVGRLMQAKCFRKDAEVTDHRPPALLCVREIMGQNCGQKFSFLRENPVKPPQALETPGRR